MELRRRNVRWVLEKWRDRCAPPFELYANLEQFDQNVARKSALRDQLMGLDEMVDLFRQAALLDPPGSGAINQQVREAARRACAPTAGGWCETPRCAGAAARLT